MGERLIELLRQRFYLSGKIRWLKSIDKEMCKYNKLREKLNRQQNVVNSLVKRYKEIYSEDLRAPKKGGDE